VNAHHPASEDDVKYIEEYFWGQATKLAALEPGKAFVGARKLLEPEMGNLRSLLQNAAQTHPSVEVTDVAVKLSSFLRWTNPSIDLLDMVVHLVPDTASPGLTAEFYRIMSDNLYGLARFGEAAEALAKAREIFLAIPDMLGAARCLRRLGHILRVHHQFEEAKDVLIRARQDFEQYGDPIRAIRCSQVLGEVYLSSGEYEAAVDVMTACRADFIRMKYLIGAAQCSRILGFTLYAQSKYDEAADVLTKALALSVEIGDQRGVAQCTHRLGDILRVQGKFTEALRR